jgi:hypothetical protein
MQPRLPAAPGWLLSPDRAVGVAGHSAFRSAGLSLNKAAAKSVKIGAGIDAASNRLLPDQSCLIK